ncbi:MAG: DnaB-like helicase C-terminal domain-containing protein [Parabacteroides merdae]
MKLLAGVTDDMDGLREHASGGVDVRMAAEVAREVLARSFRNQEAREKGEHIQVRTGFDELDDLTGGLYRGELAVLSGRPSMGKTAVALHMALQAARAGRNTLLFQHRDGRGGGDGTYPFDAERRGGRQDPFQGDEPRGACVVGESGG